MSSLPNNVIGDTESPFTIFAFANKGSVVDAFITSSLLPILIAESKRLSGFTAFSSSEPARVRSREPNVAVSLVNSDTALIVGHN